eukprot:1794360-Lingulodinium_polyedra.AAC.1
MDGNAWMAMHGWQCMDGNLTVAVCCTSALLCTEVLGSRHSGCAGRLGEPLWQPLFKALCCWAGWLMETSGWWERMKEDALQHAPVPRGVKRARRIDPHLREQLAEH